MNRTKRSEAPSLAALLAHVEKFHQGTVFKTKLIRHGYNHDVYELKSKATGESYIAYVGRGSRDSGSSLSHALRALTYLEHVGFEYAPRIVSYDAKQDILVETNVGTDDISASHLTPQQVRACARQLALLHSYSASDVLAFAKKHRLGAVRVANPLKDIAIFGTQRFKIAKQLCPDEAVIAWIEPRLKANVRFLKEKASGDGSNAHLCWGDPGDFRTDGKRLYMIDWEYGHVGGGSELGYMKIHAGFSPEMFALLTKEYARISGKSRESLREEEAFDNRIVRLNDVIWAAMKWGESREIPAQARKYKKLTYERMQLFEDAMR